MGNPILNLTKLELCARIDRDEKDYLSDKPSNKGEV